MSGQVSLAAVGFSAVRVWTDMTMVRVVMGSLDGGDVTAVG